MTVPGPGWYPDPAEASHVRWWSGVAWTDHRAPKQAAAAAPAAPAPVASQPLAPQPAAPVLAEAPPYVPFASHDAQRAYVAPPKLSRGEKDRQVRRNNPLGYAGCVLALVGLIFNIFAIPSILATVFSAIGLAKSFDLERRGLITGRGIAIAGLVIGIVDLLLVFAVAALRAYNR